MQKEEIEDLLVKYVSKTANASELDILNEWIKDPKNLLKFKEFIKTQYAITISMNNPDSSEIRDRLLKEIRKEKSVFFKNRIKKIAKYAAIGLVFLSIRLFYENIILKDEHVIQKENVITLKQANGEIKVLNTNAITEVKNKKGEVVGKQNGNLLLYNFDTGKNDLEYNVLQVPYGHTFNVVLSDSTKITLNSGSKLKYPVQFIEGNNRLVELDGEGFFEVAKNKDVPFIVVANSLDIQVYGTKFNVSNYQEDTQTNVVLVEGSVGLKSSIKQLTDGHQIMLQPGVMGVYHKTKNNITTKDVNTEIYTSWLRGHLVFRNSSFQNILKKLERHYNVICINTNKELSKETFNASIDTEKESIEEVLEYFNKVYKIEYQITGNKIIIN